MTKVRLPLGLLIVIAGLMPRVVWVSYATVRDGAALQLPDEALHWQLAGNLVELGELITDDGRYAARMPLYPLFLALFAGWGDDGVIAVRGVQCLMGAATAWLVWWSAARVLGQRVGVVAGLLAALDPHAIFFSNLLLTETLFTLIGVALFSGLARILSTVPERERGGEVKRPSPGTPASRAAWLGLAVLGAMAVLTRPSSLGLVVLYWIVGILAGRPRGRMAAGVAVCAGLLLAGLLPWGIRNYAVLADYAWLSTNGGVTLYDGQGPQATGASDQSFLAETPGPTIRGEVPIDQELRRLAIEQMQRDPARVLRLAGVKFLRTWSLTPNAEAYRSGVRDWASVGFTGLVLLGAAVGTWRLRRRPRMLVMLWLPIVYVTLVHCVYVGSLRYRVPVMPFMEILAAAAIAAPRAGNRSATPAAT